MGCLMPIYSMNIERGFNCSICGNKHIYQLRIDVIPKTASALTGPKSRLMSTIVKCPKRNEGYKVTLKVPEDTTNIEVMNIR
jgi:hypothetical protein